MSEEEAAETIFQIASHYGATCIVIPDREKFDASVMSFNEATRTLYVGCTEAEAQTIATISLVRHRVIISGLPNYNA